LIAIAVGALEKIQIGPRSFVYSEKEMLEKAKFEFSETEDFLKAAESFLIPYQFKNYDLLLLPPSFPYGGMENTFEIFFKLTILDVRILFKFIFFRFDFCNSNFIGWR
jgi:leukotriene-A4 hydrolase